MPRGQVARWLALSGPLIHGTARTAATATAGISRATRPRAAMHSECTQKWCGALDLADHRHDPAEDRGIIARNRVERRIVWQQPDLICAALERLHGGLAVDHRRDDVAVVSG